MYSYDRTAKLDSDDLKEIQELTQANDHVGADALRAKLLGLRKAEQLLKLVGQIRDLEGNMPHSLRGYADELHSTVMTVGKRHLSPEDFAEFKR